MITIDAIGDGFSDDSPAIQNAFDQARPGDTLSLESGKSYRVNSGLFMRMKDTTLLGYGATLDSSGLNANALSVLAPGNGIYGLRLVGPSTSEGIQADTIGGSRGIYVDDLALNTLVRDCRLAGFHAGGVVVRADHCTIQGNHFDGVRNYRVAGAGLGSLHFWSAFKCIAIDNMITGVQNCGIGASNSANIIILGNYIQGADYTVNPLAAKAMGVVFMNNANHCLIAHNIIERLPYEGIILSTGYNGPTCSHNSIIGNHVYNTNYHAINLRSVGGVTGSPHYSQYNLIANNKIFADNLPEGKGMAAGIGLEAGGLYDFCNYNQICSNQIIGANGKLKRGFRTLGPGYNVAHNHLMSNLVIGATEEGILHAGRYSDIVRNQIHGCHVGIQVAYGRDADLQDNRVTDSGKHSILLTGAPTRLNVRGNKTDMRITTEFAKNDSWWMEENHVIGQEWFGHGKLVAGSLLITNPVFRKQNSDGVVQVFRMGKAIEPTGFLDAILVDDVVGTIKVFSTEPADEGRFCWKSIR